ncbi:MAG: hypothetical protein IT332_11545 [Ardenticatenales bacterium]|nr:hypothetical protein [Ardenticatenales bacterium]
MIRRRTTRHADRVGLGFVATVTTVTTVRTVTTVGTVTTVAVLTAILFAGATTWPATAQDRDTAPTSRIHLPLVARAVDRRDLPGAVEAPPTPPATATSDAAPSPTVPAEPTPTGPLPSPTVRACAGTSLPERVGITRSPIDNPLRASDEYFPLPVAPRADGGALVAWREQRSATVRVGTFSAATGGFVPPALSFPAEEVHALVAHDDGGGALAVVDGDPDIYSPKYCRGASTPDKALCGKMDVWRFDAAGETVWRRTVTGKTNVDRDGAEFVWWYQHTARLVWTGDAYGLYYRNASSSPRPGVAGEIDIHAADAFRVLSPEGGLLTHAWRWGCSHSWAVRLAFNGAFGTACHGDGFPNAFHVVVADRTAQLGEATLQANVDPTKRALGGLVADGDGFWLLYQAPDGGTTGGSSGAGTMRLHLARIDNAGRIAADDVLAAATNLPTQYPFRPYLAAYGGDRLLAGWHSGGQLQLAVMDGRTGDLVEGPAGVDAQIDAWNDFVAFPNGNVGWAYAADRASTIDFVRVGGCR